MPSTVLPAEWTKRPDPRTGREVWQLTSDPAGSEAVYFEAQGFTADEHHLVFRSDRGGRSRPWRCDLRTGELALLAEGTPLDGRGMGMHPDGEHAWAVADDAVWRIHVPTGRAERLWRNAGQVPGVLHATAITFTRDGTRCALQASGPRSADPIPDSPTRATRIPCQLIWFDCVARAPAATLAVHEGFSHPMINPARPDLASFVLNGDLCWNMELPQERRVRTWLADARTGEVRPFITPQPHRTVTHETWSPDGTRMWFFDKNAGDWTPVSICSVALDGSDWRAHFTSYRHRLGHGRLDDAGRSFVSDCQNRGDSALLQIDAATGAHGILCWPDASNDGGHPAAAHVHPSWSPSGRFACFTSDRSGAPQVHVVPLAP